MRVLICKYTACSIFKAQMRVFNSSSFPSALVLISVWFLVGHWFEDLKIEPAPSICSVCNGLIFHLTRISQSALLLNLLGRFDQRWECVAGKWITRASCCKYRVSGIHVLKMDGCGSCSCLSPPPSFPPFFIPTHSNYWNRSFLHSKSRQSGRTLECRISSRSSLLSLWFGSLLVDGWISLSADLKSAARRRCWFERLLCVHSSSVLCTLGVHRSLFSFFLAPPSHARDSFFYSL